MPFTISLSEIVNLGGRSVVEPAEALAEKLVVPWRKEAHSTEFLRNNQYAFNTGFFQYLIEMPQERRFMFANHAVKGSQPPGNMAYMGDMAFPVTDTAGEYLNHMALQVFVNSGESIHSRKHAHIKIAGLVCGNVILHIALATGVDNNGSSVHDYVRAEIGSCMLAGGIPVSEDKPILYALMPHAGPDIAQKVAIICPEGLLVKSF